MMLEISNIMMMEDRETGELFFDLETGEMNTWPVVDSWHIETLDAETGEFEPYIHKVDSEQRRIFQVPKSALCDGRRFKRRSKSRGRPHVTVVSAMHKDETVPDNNSFYKRVYTTCFPILVLLMFLPAWVASVCFLSEWVLHIIAHHTTKIGCFRLYNPLCYFTSNMCAICQSQRAAEKVIQIQDRRKLRAINKKLEYLGYVNKIIS